MFDLKSLITRKTGGDLYTQDLSPPETALNNLKLGGNDHGNNGPPAWLYYMFLVIVLIILIDQGCREEPSEIVSKFNPLKWDL